MSSEDIDNLAIADAKAKTGRGNKISSRNDNEDPFQKMLELFADVNASDGSYVIAAAEGLEQADEDERLKNGVFTYYLLNDIKNKTADLNQDKDITIGELKDYIVEEVLKAASDPQGAAAGSKERKL